jgi:hypothetical protein
VNWIPAGLVLLMCVGIVLADLNTIRVRGTTKSPSMNNIQIFGLVALILGSVLMCSAAVMFAVWLPGDNLEDAVEILAGRRGPSLIRDTGLIGVLLSLVGTFLIRNAINRVGRRQS